MDDRPRAGGACWFDCAGSQRVERTFDRTTALRQFFHQLRFDALSVLKSLPFLILLGFGLINLITSARLSNRLFGTEAHPVTALMSRCCAQLPVPAGADRRLLRRRGDLARARCASRGDRRSAGPSWVPLLAKTGAFAVCWRSC